MNHLCDRKSGGNVVIWVNLHTVMYTKLIHTQNYFQVRVKVLVVDIKHNKEIC